MKERTVEEIEEEIAKVSKELSDVHGTETEVYSRIVGYYRAVNNWNKGKKDEFFNRKLFTVAGQEKAFSDDTETTFSTEKQTTQDSNASSIEESDIYYELYTKDKCPNCPPVIQFMKGISISGTTIDVGTEEGLSIAAKNGVFASPTVIFYNSDKKEISRSHCVEELKEFLEKVPVAVNEQ